MPVSMTHAATVELDQAVVAGSKWCPRCRRAKPLTRELFYFDADDRPLSTCKPCRKRYDAERARKPTPARRAAEERRRRENPTRNREYKAAWQRTPLGRLRNSLYVTRHLYKRRPTETLRETIELLTLDIARLKGDS